MLFDQVFQAFSFEPILGEVLKPVVQWMVTKTQTLLPSLHWSCLLLRLVYPIMSLNIKLATIFFPLDKMLGLMRSGTCFILSIQYRQCRKDEIVMCRASIGNTHLTRFYILKKHSPLQGAHCHLDSTPH